MDTELQALMQQEDEANKKKAMLKMIGGIGDSLSNEQSVGNFYLGQMNPHNSGVSKTMDAQADAISDPMDRQAKAMKYLQAKREDRDATEKDTFKNGLKDENSKAAKAFKQTLISSGADPAAIAGSSAFDLYTQGYSPSKMAEIKAKSNVDFNNDMAKLRYSKGADMEKYRAEQNSPKHKYDNLPEDQKLTIQELAKKNADKMSIGNQINAVMGTWDDLPDDQKVAQGNQLLKTLNSVEGKDAVGHDEAERLAAKLQYAMGNFTNSNPTQFGRDLPGFAEQARATARNIGTAVKSNKAIIDQAYGRTQESAPEKTPQQHAQEELARRKNKKVAGK